ncbi:MAG TPA: PQQ-dependent dehydrogenase, methanol/ethanol family [Verrucomicrobiae bacterium]|nr:PQQ-dependent dehydrogenase, methanol/ethanol family [Verrucomicrobiae bacterium]
MKICVFFTFLLAASASAQVKVPFERIRHAADEPGNWLTYGGNYNGHRHSMLEQITPKNVAALKPAWVYQSREAGRWEVTPLVVDGIIYVSERPNIVTALDGRTGRPLWNYRRPLPDDVPACCGPVSRGLAVLGDAVYLNTFDCHLVCLDANTGKERWDSVVTNYKNGYSITAAPLAVKDKIIVGISGAEYGIRGFLDAYDAKTGARAWRFWTIPSEGEPGNESWGTNGAWKTGGASTWITGTYDPDLNLVYWGTGNPGPDYNGDVRPGDDLYSCCVVALNADTGILQWHYQYTPHDVHDWDSAQVPLLIDAKVNNKPRKLLVQANRNAFFYVLDRVTGEFITGKAFAKQTWASGLDAKGRPILIPDKEPSADGTLVYPGLEGAVNWPSPSYSPQTGLFYAHAQDDYGQVFYKSNPEYEVGQVYTGGDPRNVLGAEPYGVVKAIEATTGTVKWEFREVAQSNAAMLSTGSGLVFTGTYDGYFYALDAVKGKPLWQFQTGASIQGGPVTFLVNGKQYVAVAAGGGLFAFAL